MIARIARFARPVAAALAGSILIAAQTGCTSSYATPGKPAPLVSSAQREAADRAIDPSIKSEINRVPLAAFPAALAAVRVQGADFQQEGLQVFGSGSFRVVTTQEAESDADLAPLLNAGGIRGPGIATLNSLVLPSHLDSWLDLRQAAASLRADIVIVYTFDTSDSVEDHLTPLSFLSLGLSPNVTADVTSTATAMLMDTKTGYIYGTAQATEKGHQLTNSWMITQAVSDAHRGTESACFKKLALALAKTWPTIVATYAPAFPADKSVQPTALEKPAPDPKKNLQAQ